MKTSKIIQVEVNFKHDLLAIKGSESSFTYYSNLTLAFGAIKEALLINGWEIDSFNYTAIYRALKQKGTYVKMIKTSGTPFFKISLSYKTLNPKLDTLDIVRNPV